MAGLTSQEVAAVQVFKEKLQQAFGDRLRSVLLFGSKARGDANQDSDVDVLIVLDRRQWEDEKKVFSLVTDVFLEVGEYLSPKIYGESEVVEKRRRNNVFFQFVDEDAVVI